MKLKRIATLMVLSISFAFVACSSGPEEEDGYKLTTYDVYAEAVDGEDVQLIDVRTAEEFQAGHINGALNYDYLSGEVDLLISELDKSKPVYVYCRSGKRSASSAEILIDAGFKKVIDLKGGFMSWTQAGMPVNVD
jgi:rhodanese-related sulfurtransferase